MDAAGNLYGATQFGGVGLGLVYKLTPDGVKTVLHAFTGGTDGSVPSTDLIIDAAGNLYSVLINGGLNGQVYQVAPDGTKTNLHSFESGGDGSTPVGALYQGPNDDLYGTTLYGTINGHGCVYQVFHSCARQILTGIADARRSGAPVYCTTNCAIKPWPRKF